MKLSNSLRYRIIKASFVMTVVICLLFTAGLYLAIEVSEENLFEEHLQADMNTVMEQYAVSPGIVKLPRSNFSVYTIQDGNKTGLPDFLRNLPEGKDDIERDGRKLELRIRKQGRTSFYFLIEDTAFDRLEEILSLSILIIIIIICMSSVILAYIFSNQIIRPVTDLAAHVNQLENTYETGEKKIVHSKDEIDVLAYAIDSFQLRVSELLNREREFSSETSHELRTPLMGIQAAAENLQIGDNTPRCVELAKRIEARCRQMRILIDSILFLARDPHSLENDFEPVDLHSVVLDQIDSALPHIESRGVSTLIIENGRPLVFTSAAILCVVFGNLLRNAIIHSQSKDVHIEISDRGFSIKDFGQGIPPELKERMFERYTYEGSATGNSVGIGLSLVKRLCDHFGWALVGESEQKSGTTITVDFRDSVVT